MKNQLLTVSFWAGNSPLQETQKALAALLPASGKVPAHHRNPALETFRKAQNCYYDLYNNGLCNRAAEFAAVFRVKCNSWRRNNEFTALATDTERAMEAIVLAAAKEQGVTA